jgi:hypothetical protein
MKNTMVKRGGNVTLMSENLQLVDPHNQLVTNASNVVLYLGENLFSLNI